MYLACACTRTRVPGDEPQTKLERQRERRASGVDQFTGAIQLLRFEQGPIIDLYPWDEAIGQTPIAIAPIELTTCLLSPTVPPRLLPLHDANGWLTRKEPINGRVVPRTVVSTLFNC